MFERFTTRARKVMALANQEAQRFNHLQIGTEHILLALIKEGTGVAANTLANLDIDFRSVRIEVEKLIKTGPDIVIAGKLSQTVEAGEVIGYAIEAAQSLDHTLVGTEHLLLGLIKEEKGVAHKVLVDTLKLSYDVVKEEVLALLGANVESSEKPLQNSKILEDSRLTDQAKKVFKIADTEARLHGLKILDTDMLFFGLTEEGSGVAAIVLKNHEASADNILTTKSMSEIFANHGVEDDIAEGPLDFSRDVHKVISFAVDEAKSLGHNYVGTEHLLLGIVRKIDGYKTKAQMVLAEFNIRPRQLKDEVYSLLGIPTQKKPTEAHGGLKSNNSYLQMVELIDDIMNEFLAEIPVSFKVIPRETTHVVEDLPIESFAKYLRLRLKCLLELITDADVNIEIDFSTLTFGSDINIQKMMSKKIAEIISKGLE